MTTRKLKKAIKELRMNLEAENSICVSLEAKGEQTQEFPIDEYTRGKFITSDVLTRLATVEAELHAFLKSRERRK